MATDSFRKNAVNEVETPEQLNQHIKIIKPAMWLVWLALIIALGTVVLWSVTYNISDGMDVGGVLFTNKDIINVTSERTDQVTDVLVSEGEHINNGDIIAIMSNDDILTEITEKEDELLTLSPESAEYKEMQSEIDELQAKYRASSVIKSDYSGYIQSVKGIGSFVNTGDVIASIMSDAGYDELIAYVPFEYAKVLNLGMETQVSPYFADREEYGYMSGVITKISSVPATDDSIIKSLGTLSYVDGIIDDEVCVEVRIKLDLDMSSQNQYKWSNKKGESLSIGYGTQCNVKIVTDKYHPYELLFK